MGEKGSAAEDETLLSATADTEAALLSQLRQRVWEMRHPEDIETVAELLRDGLDRLGISFLDYGLNVIDESEQLSVLRIVHSRCADGTGWSIRRFRQRSKNITAMWRSGRVYYRPNLEAEDIDGVKQAIRDDVQHAVQSVLDVPFSHGTLAFNSDKADAFSPQEIEILIRVSQVISEGFRRTEDLERLRAANEQLREKERLLTAFQRIGESLLASLDRDEILDKLAEEVVDAGIFRSLMVALVDGEYIEVVRSLYVDADDDKKVIENKLGLRYALSGDNISAYIVRKGEFEVIEGWDKRFDDTVSSPERMANHVAYFLPVKKGDEVIAVLATGSDLEDKNKILTRIHAMQPLLNQVAIALEHARLYKERQEQSRQLVHLERLRAVGEMAAGISHNLNNILVGILGPSQSLCEELPAGPWREEAGDIATAAKRAADIVRRLNESVRGLQEQVLAVDVEPVVHAVVRNTRPCWKDIPEARGHQVGIHIGSLELPFIRASESGLYNVVVNLIFNAVDAMPNGGSLSIEGRCVGDEVELKVSDTGTGMDEETRRRIFEPFFTTKADVGTGLGLSTVYGTIENWGGRIEVESLVGTGTTFTLRLPIWGGEEGGVVAEEDDSVQMLTDGRVLLIDDDEMVLSVLERILRKRYEVKVCRGADEILKVVESESYDVALIDWGMPDMLGDELAEKIRAIDPRIALVLMSGWSIGDEGMPTSAFDSYLAKPFGQLDLVRKTVSDGVSLSRRRAQKG